MGFLELFKMIMIQKNDYDLYSSSEKSSLVKRKGNVFNFKKRGNLKKKHSKLFQYLNFSGLYKTFMTEKYFHNCQPCKMKIGFSPV